MLDRLCFIGRMVVAYALALSVSSIVRAQCQSEIAGLNPLAGVDGEVQHVGVWPDPDGPGPFADRLIALGGPIRGAGTATAQGALVFDGATWAALPPLDPIWTGGRATSTSHLGSLYITANSKAYRLDGTVWTHLAGVDAQQILSYNGDLYAAGSRYVSGQQIDRGVFRWTGSAWEQFGGLFTATSGTPSATHLAVFNGQLTVGGRFSACNGVPCDSVAVWNGTAWNPLGSFELEGVSTIRSLVVWQNSLAAVVETLIDGHPGSAHLFSCSNGAWGLLTNLIPADTQLFTRSESLFALGNLPPQVTGARRSLLARWANGFWEPIAQPADSNSSDRAKAAVLFDGRIVLAGRFSELDGRPLLNIGTLATDGWDALGPGLDYPISGFAESAGQVIAFGRFRHAGSVDARSVVRWDGADWHAMGGGLAPTVEAVQFFQGQPVAAGTNLLGAAGAVVRFDGTDWHEVGVGLSGTAYALAEFNGELIAAGSLEVGDPPASTAVARWDGQVWQPIPFGIPYAYALVVYQGRLVATTAGVSANQGRAVLQWDGQSVTPLGSGFARAGGSFAYPNLARVFGDDLIVAGHFTMAGGVACTNIAAWNGQEWRALDLGVPTSTTGLSEYRGRLLAFSGNGSLGNLQWDGVTWTSLPSESGNASAAIELADGRLLLNSSSFPSEGTRSFSFTLYSDNGLCRADFDCSGQATLQDLFDFLTAYFAGDSRADINGSGHVTVGDVFAFIEYFFKPC